MHLNEFLLTFPRETLRRLAFVAGVVLLKEHRGTEPGSEFSILFLVCLAMNVSNKVDVQETIEEDIQGSIEKDVQ